MGCVDPFAGGPFHQGRRKLAADAGEIGDGARHADLARRIDSRIASIPGETECKSVVAGGPDLGHDLADGKKLLSRRPSGDQPVGERSRRTAVEPPDKPLSPKAGQARHQRVVPGITISGLVASSWIRSNPRSISSTSTTMGNGFLQEILVVVGAVGGTSSLKPSLPAPPEVPWNARRCDAPSPRRRPCHPRQ